MASIILSPPGATSRIATFMCTLSASLVSWVGARLKSTWYVIHNLYQPRMIDDDQCGIVGEMRIDRGNRGTRRKSVPMPFCPPPIPHDLTWARTRAAAVGVVNRIEDAVSDGHMDRLAPNLFKGVVPTVEVT
jgi:hypothetical protein